MKRVVWLTDIHLNFLPGARSRRFCPKSPRRSPTRVLISGDIGESHDVCDYLGDIHQAVRVPTYFVLGNHDYYHGSIYETRRRVDQFCAERPRLHYLSSDEAHALATHVGVVGHDGWADGRLGDYARSLVMMHDWKLITNWSATPSKAAGNCSRAWATKSAEHLRRVLPPALDEYRDVVLVTHVPPFREACWHEGGISNDQWPPHFTCKATGDAILEVMRAHPDNRLTVLCGHTHGHGETQPLQNVQVITGAAQYGARRSAACSSSIDRVRHAPAVAPTRPATRNGSVPAIPSRSASETSCQLGIKITGSESGFETADSAG